MCVIILALLGFSFFDTCMADKELTKSTKQRWGWGWGWGWSRGGDQGQGQGQRQGGWPQAPSSYNLSHGGDCPFTHKNKTLSRKSNKIVVGGSANWNFGFNYTDWALRNGPFYINDKLGTYIHTYITLFISHCIFVLFNSFLVISKVCLEKSHLSRPDLFRS